MKISPLVLMMAGALVGALAWGSCNATKADLATIRLEEALSAQRDSASQWHTTREGLTVRLQALQRDSGVLALRYEAASRTASAARHRGDSLLALLPDTLRVAVRLTFDSLAGESLACRGLLGNCELRAQNAEARVQGDSLQLHATQILLDSVGVAWHTEQRKNRPGFLGMRDLYRAKEEIGGITAIILTIKLISGLLHH